jgi:hypothetical protein
VRAYEVGSDPIAWPTRDADDTDSSPEATPPGAGAARGTIVLDGIEDAEGVGIRLCSVDEFLDSDVLELALPEFDEVSGPDDVPDDDEEPELDVVVPAFLGTAWAAAAIGTANPNATKSVVRARIDLVMTVAPWGLRDQPRLPLLLCCKSTASGPS